MTGRERVLAAAMDVLPYPKDMPYHEWRSWVRTFVNILFDGVEEELANSILSESEKGTALGGTEE